MKVSILTAVFGGYEPAREPYVMDPEIEYVCVTDNRDMQSSVWKVMYAPGLTFMDVKHNPFAFTEGDVVIWLDGSYQIKWEPSQLVDAFVASGKDFALCLHGGRHNAFEEAAWWYGYRELGEKQFLAFTQQAVLNGLKSDVLYQTSVMLFKRNQKMEDFWGMVREMSEKCSVDKMYRDDQSIVSMVSDLLKWGPDDVMLLDFLSIAHNSIWDWKEHGTDDDNYHFDFHDRFAWGKERELYRIK